MHARSVTTHVCAPALGVQLLLQVPHARGRGVLHLRRARVCTTKQAVRRVCAASATWRQPLNALGCRSAVCAPCKHTSTMESAQVSVKRSPMCRWWRRGTQLVDSALAAPTWLTKAQHTAVASTTVRSCCWCSRVRGLALALLLGLVSLGCCGAPAAPSGCL
jgi:hypothetical protein